MEEELGLLLDISNVNFQARLPLIIKMYVHNLNPTLLEIGFLEVRYYGLVYAFAFLLLYIYLCRKRDSLKISRSQADNIVLALLIGLVAGERIFHFMFSEPLTLIKNPLEIFMLWHGGMSFFGGLLGGFLAVYLYLKKSKLGWKKFGDIIAITAITALIFGRIANFINGEIVGTASNLPWCVIFPQIDYVCRHPYQLYAALSHALLLGVLLVVNNIKQKKDGLVFCAFLIGYGILRFLTDFLRQDPRLFGLTLWQYLSIALALVGFCLLYFQKFYKKK